MGNTFENENKHIQTELKYNNFLEQYFTMMLDNLEIKLQTAYDKGYFGIQVYINNPILLQYFLTSNRLRIILRNHFKSKDDKLFFGVYTNSFKLGKYLTNPNLKIEQDLRFQQTNLMTETELEEFMFLFKDETENINFESEEIPLLSKKEF